MCTLINNTYVNIICSPKNYQLWYHRRALLEFRFKGEPEESLQVAQKELGYVDKILGDDSKNYHVSIFHYIHIDCKYIIEMSVANN